MEKIENQCLVYWWYLPGDGGKYKLMEKLDDGELEFTVEFWTDDFRSESGEIQIEKYSNITSFLEDLKTIVDRDGWNYIPNYLLGVFERHPALDTLLEGNTSIKGEFIDKGEDGERLILIESEGKFLVYAEGNSASPFEFTSRYEVDQFVRVLCIARLNNSYYG